jgi:UDP-glucose 4-epimerase
MRVMVTGGAGYIGSVVVEELVRVGHQVVVYDNLSRGHAGAVVQGAALVQADLRARDTLLDVLRAARVEAVVHMAADSLVGESMTDPGKYYRSNVQGGLALLNAMRTAGSSLVVFSSTAAVYGEPEAQPITEDAPTNPTNPYGETKLAFERALHWHDRAHGLRYASLRYFNAAGATERSGELHDPETHLVPLVLQAAIGARPEVVIFGDDYPTPDGTCIRDYIHVRDLAAAHVLALEAIAGGRPSRIYNLGCGGEGHSVQEVITLAREVTGAPIPVRVGTRRPGDPAVLVASSDRIQTELGWSPASQDLRVVIESAWRWLRARRNLGRAA